GGTNVHVVVEECPEQCEAGEVDGATGEWHLLVVSARSAAALGVALGRLAAHLGSRRPRLSDVAYTLQVGRKEFEHRFALMCQTVEDAVAGLSSGVGLEAAPGPSQADVTIAVDRERLQLQKTGSGSGEGPESAADGGGEADLLARVGRLWLRGAQIDWGGLHAGRERGRVPLPSYPFERQRYWIETRGRAGVSGSIASSVEGLLAAELPLRKDIADWFWTPSWTRAFAPAARPEGGNWLVLGADDALSEGLSRRLAACGVHVVRGVPSQEFVRFDEDRYGLRPGERGDYGRLLAEVEAAGRMVDTVVHLGLAEPAKAWRERGLEPARASLDIGFHPLVALAQALGEMPGRSRRILVVTSELADVSSGDALCAPKALAIGPCLVVPQEYQHLTCRIVDVAADVVVAAQADGLDRLVAELSRTSDVAVVALRGADRWAEDVTPVRLQAGAAPGPGWLRPGGVYLVTGGLGGIGLAVAEYLHSSVGASLVLIGRQVGAQNDRVAALQRQGADVLVLSADVGDAAQMERVVEAAIARFGALHGVFHAAGVPPSGLIQNKTAALAEAVMRPKLAGVLALQQALTGRSLDFLCLFSSISSR
ncbi:SDR family NAD(P)-dependent oxidoreductase, partial [Mesorhizobium sp. M0772]|uniref:SDR family NAD(P)-dependent oxidoreductase n=1 Tax=Mesorhizobium sp. M0772 TaxID=2956998 RepID=UPI003336D384